MFPTSVSWELPRFGFLPRTGHRSHTSNATFALVVPYVALLILAACRSNLPTEICKKGLSGVLSKQ